MSRTGFSLVEVVVALVVFEVGVLGTLAMTLQAQKTLLAAAALESGSRAVEWVADSLSYAGWGGPGSIDTEQGIVRWIREEGGLDKVTYEVWRVVVGSVGLSPAPPDVP